MQLKLLIKILIIFLAGVYFIWYAIVLPDWTFLDGVDLIIHEAGHFVFIFFGKFIRVAGGTIMQILMPLIFVLYFFLKKQYFSVGLIMLWLGQSFINVSVYAKDAVLMELPLLGAGAHDWNYLLGKLNLLSKTPIIAGCFYWTGFIIIIFAIITALLSFKKQL